MFNFFKKKKQPEQENDTAVTQAPEVITEVSTPEAPSVKAETAQDTSTPAVIDAFETAERPAAGEKKSLFSRLKSGLSKTGNSLTEGMGNLFLGSKKIDEDVLEELETRLLMADVGVEATTKIIDSITQQVDRNELADTEALMQVLYKSMTEILGPVAKATSI